MKKLGCTMCILAFSSFSSLISALKDENARMHIVHPSFFILQLTEVSTYSELKDENARMHNVHPSFFIIHLTDFSTLSELKYEKLGCTMCIMAFSSFTSMISALPGS